jgi:hypothetical protein
VFGQYLVWKNNITAKGFTRKNIDPTSVHWACNRDSDVIHFTDMKCLKEVFGSGYRAGEARKCNVFKAVSAHICARGGPSVSSCFDKVSFESRKAERNTCNVQMEVVIPRRIHICTSVE